MYFFIIIYRFSIIFFDNKCYQYIYINLNYHKLAVSRDNGCHNFFLFPIQGHTVTFCRLTDFQTPDALDQEEVELSEYTKTRDWKQTKKHPKKHTKKHTMKQTTKRADTKKQTTKMEITGRNQTMTPRKYKNPKDVSFHDATNNQSQIR